MRATDEVDVEVLREFLDHVLSEGVTDAALVLAPSFDLGIRVRPKEVAKQSLIWHFDGSFDIGDIGEVGQIRRESSMHADDLLINDGTDRHDVEDIEEVLPNLEVVASFAYFTPGVHSS
jgi:hypothetical protein